MFWRTLLGDPRWSESIRDDIVKVKELSEWQHWQNRFRLMTVDRQWLQEKADWWRREKSILQKDVVVKMDVSDTGPSDSLISEKDGDGREGETELEELKEENLRIKMEKKGLLHDLGQLRRKKRSVCKSERGKKGKTRQQKSRSFTTRHCCYQGRRSTSKWNISLLSNKKWYVVFFFKIDFS